ncbi:NAD(P)-dependent dehydrogenase (short-subunit alcohol dehydrogenase family) [Pseudomonas sp. JUb42]|jgi:NAD(P)-dependent dehydrogenase (short-subunit alcohol dehydrogenase family)|uniref:SDR family NAD(P)-dependent oxidoreductase n=1 Tax=Pseudomonas sp. JUb42 TaxID=2940611 RepID=UPI0021691F62|nr:SDR family oxidoreductase [Pseudomonas sp. JUb42]MCS3471535.1 NAD(P)-dependent dehydrogenase (short-subunit alcohol dehydrogenase family) [Pseudomonas sp. JUb42]
MQFQDKVVLVTGGSSGLGLAIAQELAGQGAHLVITGRRQEQLDEAVSTLGNHATAVVADVSSAGDLNALINQIESRHGRIDVLVANAGMGELAPLGSITEAHFDRVFNTNVKGVAFTVQGALPLMGNGGSIVIIGSTASINPGPGLGVYGATKAALRALVRSWVLDIKGSGVRINLLSPGPVNTESLHNMLAEHAEEVIRSLSEKSTLGRIGEAQEIGKAVAFLASDASSYINGVELFADGGASQV